MVEGEEKNTQIKNPTKGRKMQHRQSKQNHVCSIEESKLKPDREWKVQRRPANSRSLRLNSKPKRRKWERKVQSHFFFSSTFWNDFLPAFIRDPDCWLPDTCFPIRTWKCIHYQKFKQETGKHRKSTLSFGWFHTSITSEELLILTETGFHWELVF